MNELLSVCNLFATLISVLILIAPMTLTSAIIALLYAVLSRNNIT